jgi:hypothetical protein
MRPFCGERYDRYRPTVRGMLKPGAKSFDVDRPVSERIVALPLPALAANHAIFPTEWFSLVQCWDSQSCMTRSGSIKEVSAKGKILFISNRRIVASVETRSGFNLFE